MTPLFLSCYCSRCASGTTSTLSGIFPLPDSDNQRRVDLILLSQDQDKWPATVRASKLIYFNEHTNETVTHGWFSYDNTLLTKTESRKGIHFVQHNADLTLLSLSNVQVFWACATALAEVMSGDPGAQWMTRSLQDYGVCY